MPRVPLFALQFLLRNTQEGQRRFTRRLFNAHVQYRKTMNRAYGALIVFVLLFIAMLLFGCASRPPRGPSCAVVNVLPDHTHCEPWGDGGTVCSGGNPIPPQSWGKCVEDTSNEFTCLDGDTIAHYVHGPRPTWRIAALSCPDLAKQLEAAGTNHFEFSIPLGPVEPAKKADDKGTT